MSLFNKVTKTFQWGGKTVVMETGEIARQATGAVVVDIEGTGYGFRTVLALPAERTVPATVCQMKRP